MNIKEKIINNLDYDLPEMLRYADSYSPSYLIEHLDSIMQQFYPKIYDFSNLTEEEQNNLYIDIAEEIKDYIEEHKNEAIYQEAITLEDFLNKDDSIGEETKLDEQLMAFNRERGFFDIGHKIYITEPGETHSELLKREFNIGNGRDSRDNNPDEDFAYGVILPDNIYLIEPGSINSKTVMKDIYDNGFNPSKIYFYDRFDNNYLVRLANNSYDEFIKNYLDESILSERVALDDLLTDSEIDEDIKDYIKSNPDKYLPWTIELDELSDLNDSVGDVHGIPEYADISQRDFAFIIINHEVLIDADKAHTDLLNDYLEEDYFETQEHPSEEEMEDLGIDCVFGAIIGDVCFLDEFNCPIENIKEDLNNAGIEPSKFYVYSNELEITRVF